MGVFALKAVFVSSKGAAPRPKLDLCAGFRYFIFNVLKISQHITPLIGVNYMGKYAFIRNALFLAGRWADASLNACPGGRARRHRTHV